MSDAPLPDIFADLLPKSPNRDVGSDDAVLPSPAISESVYSVNNKKEQLGAPMVRLRWLGLRLWITPDAFRGAPWSRTFRVSELVPPCSRAAQNLGAQGCRYGTRRVPGQVHGGAAEGDREHRQVRGVQAEALARPCRRRFWSPRMPASCLPGLQGFPRTPPSATALATVVALPTLCLVQVARGGFPMCWHAAPSPAGDLERWSTARSRRARS